MGSFCQDEKGLPYKGENFPKAQSQKEQAGLQTPKPSSRLEQKVDKASAVGQDS